MKILVTGASGFVATLIRLNLSGHSFILWSRKNIEDPGQAVTDQVKSLMQPDWWGGCQFPDNIDVVIHLAEVISNGLTDVQVDLIVESHSRFLRRACQVAKVVVYPDTAFQLDPVTGRNESYREIKTRVRNALSDLDNLYSPVIHPIIDGKGALTKFIDLQKKIPIFNLFCSFKAELPVLYSHNLINLVGDLLDDADSGCLHWYTSVQSICKLTHDPSRFDSEFLSSILFNLLSIFKQHRSIHLLIEGRDLKAM
jgi:hypothetical protein